MGTPRGTRQFVLPLANGRKLLLYSQEGTSKMIIQIRIDVSTEEDILPPSVKAAAELDERAADLAARELLRFSRGKR